ncbi:hypothetical protein [Actinoplanes sp. DH11]|uniref:hypothetical protein n=1 Tax=Actinoplanes sp. DH11 TaxID=2857011 RepID=UPI001E3DBF48|nr:hypothetical protein [Actinoplanes sp. DH11]
MTGWEVERPTRTARLSRSIPAGSSTLMPPPSQGVERRPERRAGHAGSRWVLRALVIGGLAGVAWLFTGTAAHAADHDVEPAGSLSESMSHSVAPVSGNEPLVGELLQAAVQPLEYESAPKIHRRVVASILTTAERMLSRPVELPDETYYGTVIDADPQGTEPRTKPAPARTSAGEQGDRTRPEPADDATEPVTEPAKPAAEADLPPVAVPSPAEDSAAPAAATEPVRPTAAGDVRPATRAAAHVSANHSIRAHRAPAGLSPARHAKAASRSTVHRRVPAARPATTETVREEAPVDDGPTPARMNLGTVSGIPASGPGPSPEYGPVAVLPARVASGAVADHRSPVANDVEVRQHDAGEPTVSPD